MKVLSLAFNEHKKLKRAQRERELTNTEQLNSIDGKYFMSFQL